MGSFQLFIGIAMFLYSSEIHSDPFWRIREKEEYRSLACERKSTRGRELVVFVSNFSTFISTVPKWITGKISENHTPRSKITKLVYSSNIAQCSNKTEKYIFMVNKQSKKWSTSALKQGLCQSKKEFNVKLVPQDGAKRDMFLNSSK